MTKTAAGTDPATLIVRVGTLGTTGDTGRVTLAFDAGTAAIDTGIFDVTVNFRTRGIVTVIHAMARCTHHLAATGLIGTGASGTGIVVAPGVFDSRTATTIGLSFNGGASFVGTNTFVVADADNL